ncbi:uncharacterized protein LOC105167651 isoform X1 [Sesamum indicum]|uniref:Uncharacterized protein LOC105167651 isoform X1 n=1 Tax=Sesamum indicum TaxID=4182 RepID=A0A6I9TK64_SESIN|nr:uncharacterized protein LOC105167651 isoform X1 [Sesamum indicum]XP_020547715.1 uncharacterized protein LOC105167651 isoform X1 [Sesamum indicum]
MAIVSGLAFSGIRSLAIGAGYPKLPFENHNHDAHTFSKFQRGTASVLGKYPKVQIPYSHLRYQGRTHILSAGRNHHLNYNDDSHSEPFWLNLIREAIWTTRSLLLFLVEQPSQLKYIEWPSFQSTLKTATLTLVLVALLIVALSSVDSALSYLLGLILRRKA